MADNFNILDFNNSRIKNTGAVTSYAPGGYTWKDDGALQYGAISNYTVLTTGQYSGNTNVVVNGKTSVQPNACVIDNLTGLMWNSRQAASIGPASNGLLYWDDSAGANEDIGTYATACNTAGLAGHNDWFIPDFNQLISLFDASAAATPLYNPAFSFTGANLWTSTTYEPDTTKALAFNYNTLATLIGLKNTATLYVITVRKIFF